jgi:ATP-dependent RNA helicase RhlE
LKKFTDLGLSEAILRALTAEGYTEPTPIQQNVIPTMLSGRDVVGIAQTGTGKTASFVLPLLQKISESKQRPAPKSCTTLILAPTRELAAQITDGIKTYGQFMRHSVTTVVGGAKPAPQIRAMAQGLDILVATPGRLEDHLQAGVVRLDAVTTVVLDEADQMLDLGFMPAIRRLMSKLPRGRQTVLLSATMPKQIRSLANDFLKKPAEISVAPTSKPIDRIDQTVLFVGKPEKRGVLINFLKKEPVERAIVFTRTKHGANKIAQHLVKAGLTAEAIHGNKSQSQRERTLAGFRGTSVKVLVATDIAARGIDVEGVSHVVNFELPNVPEVYVHRIGRTARAGASGIAISLCDPEERGLLRDIEKLIGRSFGGGPVPAKKSSGSAAKGSSDKPAPDRPSANARRNQRRRSQKRNGSNTPSNRSGQSANSNGRKGPEGDSAGLSRILSNGASNQQRSA